MNIKKFLDYRYVRLSDDLQEVGKILYHTDKYIYPALFGSENNAKIVLSEAIRRKLYCFSAENLFGCFLGTKPIAIICKNPQGKFKWEYLEWYNLFLELDINIPIYFDNVAKNYFEKLNSEKLEGNIYILAISVLEKMRNKGIGREILRNFIDIHSSETIVLDTLEDNESAVALYRDMQFIPMEKYWGYNTEKPYPKCIRMVYNCYK